MDCGLALMCGIDIPVPECQLAIHQPKLKEIALIGEKVFFEGIQTICIKKEMFPQGESVLNNINNFQIFMTVMTEKETRDKKFAVQQVLTLLFPKFKVTITPRSIALNGDGQNLTIDETNFEALQKVISIISCSNKEDGQQNFNPANKKAKEIADKLMRGRQRIAAERSGENNSVFSQYISTLTVGLNSMSLNDCLDLTMFQLYDLIERYSLYVNWDIDIRSRLAGAKSDNKPDNWMKNIH